MRLKMTSKKHIKVWSGFFYLTIIVLILIVYAYLKSGSDALFVFYIGLGIQFVPTAYLHIMYYLENKGEEYSITKDEIIRFKNKKKEVYNSSDIKRIVICKPASMGMGGDRWGIPHTTLETFSLARVYLKDGTNFIMTNLLEYDLEKPLAILKGVEFGKRRGLSFFI